MPFHNGWLDDPYSSSLPACLLGRSCALGAIECPDPIRYPMTWQVGKASLAVDFAMRVAWELPVPISVPGFCERLDACFLFAGHCLPILFALPAGCGVVGHRKEARVTLVLVVVLLQVVCCVPVPWWSAVVHPPGMAVVLAWALPSFDLNAQFSGSAGLGLPGSIGDNQRSLCLSPYWYKQRG